LPPKTTIVVAMKPGYLTDRVKRSVGNADEQLARHLATARRQQQARGEIPRDELGRIAATRRSPLTEWEEPKRQYGQTSRHGGGRMRGFTITVPIRAHAALKMMADQRGVSLNFLVGELLAESLAPSLMAPSRSLTDRPIVIRQPDRIHSPQPPQLRRKGGYLTDRR
jgi:hypothetical protein